MRAALLSIGTELILAYRLAARVREHTPGASSIDWSIFRPVPADDLRLIEVEVRCMMGVVTGPQFSDADRAAVAAFGADWASGAQARRLIIRCLGAGSS